jgi:hypothetical protein
MPHKYNADRGHRIPRTRYKVTNWQAYEAGLAQAGLISLPVCHAVLGTGELVTVIGMMFEGHRSASAAGMGRRDDYFNSRSVASRHPCTTLICV